MHPQYGPGNVALKLKESNTFGPGVKGFALKSLVGAGHLVLLSKNPPSLKHMKHNTHFNRLHLGSQETDLSPVGTVMPKF